ncbi:MAG: hypothetical protein JRJ85_19285 [Deltaproteobacteria bacterium]|nr:hypothetical protein [Deltaproteobacteria bacterium]
MSVSVNHSVQNQHVWQRELEQVNSAKERVKTDRMEGHGAESDGDIKETVDIRVSSQRPMESKQDGREISDAEEAKNSVEDIVGLINSESESAHQAHNLNPGSLLNLLA